MKSTIKIEIESPDKHDIFPEDGETEDDYKGEEKQKELKESRERYSKELHEELIKHIKKYFDDNLPEALIDDLEEYYIEGWDKLEDYDINIKVT